MEPRLEVPEFIGEVLQPEGRLLPAAPAPLLGPSPLLPPWGRLCHWTCSSSLGSYRVWGCSRVRGLWKGGPPGHHRAGCLTVSWLSHGRLGVLGSPWGCTAHGLAGWSDFSECPIGVSQVFGGFPRTVMLLLCCGRFTWETLAGKWVPLSLPTTGLRNEAANSTAPEAGFSGKKPSCLPVSLGESPCPHCWLALAKGCAIACGHV